MNSIYVVHQTVDHCDIALTQQMKPPATIMRGTNVYRHGFQYKWVLRVVNTFEYHLLYSCGACGFEWRTPQGAAGNAAVATCKKKRADVQIPAEPGKKAGRQEWQDQQHLPETEQLSIRAMAAKHGLHKSTLQRLTQSYHTTRLEDCRACGANPALLEDYFDVSYELRHIHKLPQENIFGMGIQPHSKVLAERGQRVQHAQTNSERENVTVIKRICADGTVLLPCVIFRGTPIKHMNRVTDLGTLMVARLSGKDIPITRLDSIGSSGTMSRPKRRATVPGSYMSTATSHIALPRLWSLQISTISSSAHIPHIPHTFSKASTTPYWGQEKTIVKNRKGGHTSEETFLQIYSWARNGTFTEKTVNSAFRSTGVYPLDRTVAWERHPPRCIQRSGAPARKVVSAFYRDASKPNLNDTHSGQGGPIAPQTPTAPCRRRVHFGGSPNNDPTTPPPEPA